MQALPTHSFKVSYRHNILKHAENLGYVKSQTEKGYLLKYYPKYYTSLDLKRIDRPTAVKIKGIKRLHHMNGVLEKSQPSILGTVLMQKVWKDLRSPPMIFREREWELIEERRWFGKGFKEIRQLTGLEEIRVPRDFFQDPFQSLDWKLRNSNGDVGRILTYLAENGKLKKVNTQEIYEICGFIEEKLKDCRKLREKLNVKVGLESLYGFDISAFHIKDSVISQRITSLKTALCQIGILKDIATLGEIFQNLRVIKIIPNGYVSPRKLSETELNHMTLDFYKSIEKLPSLEKLTLQCKGDCLAWIKNFALPKSLKTFQTGFSSKKPLFPLLESSVEGALILKNFCSRIQELPLLNTLSLWINRSCGDAVQILEFVHELLKGIPRLSSLKLQLPSKNAESREQKKPLDFSLIFEGMQHLMPLLKDLEIGFDSDMNSVVCSLSPEYKFPNLRELRIAGKIGAWLILKSALMMLPGRDHFSKIQPRLEVQSLAIFHPLILSVFLRELQGIFVLEPHVELKLDLQFFSFDQKNLEDMVMTLVDFIKSGRYMKGVALKILMRQSSKLDDLFKAFQKNPIVENFEVAILDSYECETHWYKFKKGALVQNFIESEEPEEEENYNHFTIQNGKLILK